MFASRHYDTYMLLTSANATENHDLLQSRNYSQFLVYHVLL